MNHEPPRTVQEAVEQLVLQLNQADKISLRFGLGHFIPNKFGLWRNNLPRLLDCQRINGKDTAKISGLRTIHPDDASMVIIKAFWRRLRDQ